MAVLFQLIGAMVWSNIFCSSQYRSLMIILCFTMLFLLSESSEEKSIVIALMSSLVGYIILNPKLWTKGFWHMTVYSCQFLNPEVPVKLSWCFTCCRGNSFIRVSKKYYFYNEFQPLFREKQGSIARIEFIKYSGSDVTKNLWNCLLIFNNSCEEIFNDTEFVKIDTSWRHCKLHVVYVKHYLFHQSKWLRTIDLNTKHIKLFKPLRDIQQSEYYGKPFNYVLLPKNPYKLARAESYGHLIVDVDPKTSQCLRLAS